MVSGRRGLDDRLLDALGEANGQPFEGTMWRVVRVGRSALDGSRGAGRWNPAELTVLYGAHEANGAIAEMHYHLNRGQSVFPSKMQHDLYELRVATKQTLILADMDQLKTFGVDQSRYSEMLYDRTQEIAAAASFMGFDGIIAPSARWECQNIILFLDTFDLDDIEEVSSSRIDWKDWRTRNM